MKVKGNACKNELHLLFFYAAHSLIVDLNLFYETNTLIQMICKKNTIFTQIRITFSTTFSANLK